jgi:non-specific serine/threonine protein kinase
MTTLGLRLTPHGHLACEPVADAPSMDAAVADRLQQAFARGSGEGLLRLGAGEVGAALPPVFVWWRDFAARYVVALCVQAAGAEDSAALPEVSPPNEAELGFLVLTAPRSLPP